MTQLATVSWVHRKLREDRSDLAFKVKETSRNISRSPQCRATRAAYICFSEAYIIQRLVGGQRPCRMHWRIGGPANESFHRHRERQKKLFGIVKDQAHFGPLVVDPGSDGLRHQQSCRRTRGAHLCRMSVDADRRRAC